jgi:effector-binding domain-containing protein
MNRPALFRLARFGLASAVVLTLGVAASAQTASDKDPSPAAPPAPAQPATSPATAAPPATAETPAATPAPAPSATQAPPAPAPATAQVQTADPFGEEITLEPKTVLILKGKANWDNAFESLMDAIKSLKAQLDKQGITANGNPMIVYTSTDDTGFTFQAEIPVPQEPKNLAKTMSIGKSPDGKALKFVHHGSYDNMDNTYEAITNHLDEKKLEAKDTFIEEYITDPLKTAEDRLVINVYVPMK